MLRGGLEALRAREEALRTAQTLDADLARKRTRAEQLQATSHPKAVCSPPLPHYLPENVAHEVPLRMHASALPAMQGRTGPLIVNACNGQALRSCAEVMLWCAYVGCVPRLALQLCAA